MGRRTTATARAAILILALAVVRGSCTRAQEAAGDGVFQASPPAPEGFSRDDVLNLTPEGLRAAGPEALARRAQEAYAARRYEEAAAAYAQLAAMRPGVALYLYDLACCYALMSRPEQAARFLKAAWSAGYRDLGHIERDPDFTKVRPSVVFEAQMEELRMDAARRGARKGRLLLVAAPAVQRVTVLEPVGFRPGGRYPLVIGLHGAGATAEGFTDFFAEALAKRGILFCAPQGQYGLPLNDGGPMGFFWAPPEAAGKDYSPAELVPTEEYLLAVLDSVAKVYPVDARNVYLLGFSQGAHMALYISMKHPDRFAGAAAVAGRVFPEDFTPEESARSAKALRFLLCQSPEDTRVLPADSAASVEFLRRMGASPDTFGYAGGHVIRPEVVEKVAEWVSAASAVAPSRGADAAPAGPAP